MSILCSLIKLQYELRYALKNFMMLIDLNFDYFKNIFSLFIIDFHPK